MHWGDCFLVWLQLDPVRRRLELSVWGTVSNCDATPVLLCMHGAMLFSFKQYVSVILHGFTGSLKTANHSTDHTVL